MLVLTRRVGEAIQIGDDVELVVVGVQGEKVRLGVRAPRQVEVVRQELVRQVERENAAAADSCRVLEGDRSKMTVSRRCRSLK